MEFVHKSLGTNFLPNGMPFSKVAYIGACGKIGTKALPLFIEHLKKFGKTELVLVQSDNKGSYQRLKGLKMDLMEFATSIGKEDNLEITIANDYSDIANSDVTLCSAGLHASRETRQYYKKLDPTCRLIQSIVNKGVMRNIAKDINKYAPSTLFITSTNQVDTISEIIRNDCPNLSVLGLSGTVDSARLSRITYEETGKRITGKMFGYHNTKMIPLMDSIRGDALTDEEIKAITKKCVMRGMEIAINQAKGKNPNGDYGASVLPAAALANAALTFIGSRQEFTESWNVKLTTDHIAHKYGLEKGDSLSVPLRIGRGYVAFEDKYHVSESEKELIRKMRKDMKEGINKLMKI